MSTLLEAPQIEAPQTSSEAQHAALGLTLHRDSQHTTHPEAQWFPQAGLGLFIHWGIASVHGELDLSWSMMANTPWDSSAQGRNKITPHEYWRLAERFAPDKYDPDKWLRAAKAAGFQYAVFTTMHHDGYTMWPSQWSELGVQSHLNGRDLVGPFIEACRRYDIKIGLYYSPPDWYFDREFTSFNYPTHGKTHKDAPVFDIHHKATIPRIPPVGHRERARRNWQRRVEELLTGYGRIDLLWFDGGSHDNEIRDFARGLQPHIVINSRSCDGDFDSSECAIPAAPFSGWGETCHCWQASEITNAAGERANFWGYLRAEQYKPASWMAETYRQLRQLNSNFLVNVSPRPNGELPEVVYQRFEEAAKLLSHDYEK